MTINNLSVILLFSFVQLLWTIIRYRGNSSWKCTLTFTTV